MIHGHAPITRWHTATTPPPCTYHARTLRASHYSLLRSVTGHMTNGASGPKFYFTGYPLLGTTAHRDFPTMTGGHAAAMHTTLVHYPARTGHTRPHNSTLSHKPPYDPRPYHTKIKSAILRQISQVTGCRAAMEASANSASGMLCKFLKKKSLDLIKVWDICTQNGNH